jgi:branched-subunit amino acid permease
MSQTTRRLLTFILLLWLGLTIGAYFQLPRHIQTALEVKTP